MTVYLRLLALSLAVVVSACGTSGMETASLAQQPVPAGKSRLKITRSNDILYAGVPATITVNGTKVADLAMGGTALVDIPEGSSLVAASAWSYPGTFSVKLTAKAGQQYAVEIAPRTASFGPGALLGPAGGVLDASVNENAGAFEMRLATPKV